jgi:hypothetical protein
MAYRETLPALDPEVASLLAASQLATSPAALERCSAETPAIVERLCARSWNPLRRLFGWSYWRWTRQTPSFTDIPHAVRPAARELGFVPMAWVVHGPTPPLSTPNFIGPDGFVKLEVYGKQRVYLSTNFDDGTAVSTARRHGANARTTFLTATGDLRADYLAHLAEVARQMKQRGCRPLYRSTHAAMSACFRLFPAYHAPAIGIPLLLLPSAMMLFVLLWAATKLVFR